MFTEDVAVSTASVERLATLDFAVAVVGHGDAIDNDAGDRFPAFRP